jgi:hypothetical protein
MGETLVKDPPPLDELMLAMDVVDTLRHRELVLARELEADDREVELVRRLREIYTAQGIVVSDEVLAQGVRALTEDRFVYPVRAPGLARSLAVLYVSRARWGKWVGAVAAAVAIVALGYRFGVRGPALAAIEALPAELGVAEQSVLDATQDARVRADAVALADAGEAALARRDYDAARDAIGDLETLHARLERQYELKIVSRPGELSGVWRIPDRSVDAENYYLIVEAIAPNGAALTLPITSEEDGRTRNVSTWGLRVDESTFQRVAADKRDDGIIQDAVVGRKRRGALDPEYLVAATGAAITDW